MVIVEIVLCPHSSIPYHDHTLMGLGTSKTNKCFFIAAKAQNIDECLENVNEPC